jgi:hypothetical protein
MIRRKKEKKNKGEYGYNKPKNGIKNHAQKI